MSFPRPFGKQGRMACRIPAPACRLYEAGYAACLSALLTTCPGSQDLQGYGAHRARVVPSCQSAYCVSFNPLGQ